MDTRVPEGFPRPVFDPAIPVRDRDLLAANSGDLTPAHRPRPSRGRRGFERAARVHHGRYLCPADFDAEGMYLVARTQVAVEAVERTQVYQSGYLGRFENTLWVAKIARPRSVVGTRTARILSAPSSCANATAVSYRWCPSAMSS